ncbi:hypothetical protein [Nocardioides zhouii]|uniref:hypothetical protein n=1 Tax=Nocardioides zhouii TaxID=1168729 RepID=UPI0013EBA355|nr:hypothetical protein [Nocardioides zhouii]
MTTSTIYTPERVTEVRGHVASFRKALDDPATEDWRRTQLEDSLADALAWLEEAEHAG